MLDELKRIEKTVYPDSAQKDIDLLVKTIKDHIDNSLLNNEVKPWPPKELEISKA